MTQRTFTLSMKLAASIFAVFLLVGCHQDMWSQPYAKPQSKSDTLFADGSNSRGVVAGTVAFGKAKTDREFYSGFTRQGRLVKEFPVAVTPAFLRRGQERYEIFCTPCHGETGDGKGFIAQRGFAVARQPGNYHTNRLRDMPVGHYFDVITNGFGVMYPFKSRIEPMDRWAIAAYIRVLQRSQHIPIGRLPNDKQSELNKMEKSPDQDAPPELPVGPTAPRLGAPMSDENGSAEVPIGDTGQRLDKRPPADLGRVRTAMPDDQSVASPVEDGR